MTFKYTILKLRVKLKKTLTFDPKFTVDETKIIDLVKGLANNPLTTILVLPNEKIVAYNGVVNILIEHRIINITDNDEYFTLDLNKHSEAKIYNILIGIVNSRIRQAEKRINTKKQIMLDRMIKDVN